MKKPLPDPKRPRSWSAISSFEYDKEQWYRKYVLGIKEAPSKEMEFGKVMGERLASDPTFMTNVPRGTHYEYEDPGGLCAKLGKIPLIGFIDSYTPHTIGDEYKTGKKPWDQKRVDEHGQLTMYSLLLLLKHKVKPEDILWRLTWLATQDNGDFSISFIPGMKPQIFETRRTMTQVLEFASRIKKTEVAMLEYAMNHD